MPRELAPCGTHAAYVRHLRRGEPVDSVCQTAHREHMRAWTDAHREQVRATWRRSSARYRARKAGA